MINGYTFESSVIDAQKAAELTYIHGYSYQQTAEAIGCTYKSVYDLISYNLDRMRTFMLSSYETTIKEYLVSQIYKRLIPVDASFLPPELPHPEYVLNVLSDIYKTLPTRKNLLGAAQRYKTFKHIIEAINNSFTERDYVSISTLSMLDQFKTADQMLELFRCIFSFDNRFPLYNSFTEVYIFRYRSEALAQLIIDNCSTPIHEAALWDFLSVSGYYPKYPLPRLAEKCSNLYRLGFDLYGKKEDLSYPDSIHEISKDAIKKLKASSSMHIGKFYSEMEKKWPNLISRYELRSMLRNCKEIGFTNSQVFYKKP